MNSIQWICCEPKLETMAIGIYFTLFFSFFISLKIIFFLSFSYTNYVETQFQSHELMLSFSTFSFLILIFHQKNWFHIEINFHTVPFVVIKLNDSVRGKSIACANLSMDRKNLTAENSKIHKKKYFLNSFYCSAPSYILFIVLLIIWALFVNWRN